MIIKRVKKEVGMRPVIKAGYSRKMAATWYRKVQYDYKKYKDIYDKKTLKATHKRGYLARSIDKYGLINNEDNHYISDFEYLFNEPFNNSFVKWFNDVITTKKILGSAFENIMPRVYFSLIIRDNQRIIFDYRERSYSSVKVLDVINFIKSKKALVIRPSAWKSNKKILVVNYENNSFYVNEKDYSEEEFLELIDSLKTNYIVTDSMISFYEYSDQLKGNKHRIEFFVTNETEKSDKILCSVMNLIDENDGETHIQELIDSESGIFNYNDNKYCVPQWERLLEWVNGLADMFSPINYFKVSFFVTNTDIKMSYITGFPVLPNIAHSEPLNEYLKNKVKEKKANYSITFSDHVKAIKKSLFIKATRKFARKGMRPYMQKMWLYAVWDDFRNTKTTNFREKLWSWRRGFLSFRIQQYGLTRLNYKNYLSEYDYHWLNRINNMYQLWVNDKTTFRYSMSSFNDYVAKYYYLILKNSGRTEIHKLQDCPVGFGEYFEDLKKLLEEKKELALKPSAGTHGDGFYKLEYKSNNIYVNDNAFSFEELIDLIKSFKSYYIITEYLHMEETLGRIYPNSVNTIRIMVINNEINDPQIMQTYMRIGSSKTGYTDNVAFGGIVAHVNMETGEYYGGERLIDHVYDNCPIHPDTNVAIEGQIPQWDEIKRIVIDICKSMPELEFLGFDVVVSDQGIKILEINIHQDLHKVGEYTNEINTFFRRKIKSKKEYYGLKK